MRLGAIWSRFLYSLPLLFASLSCKMEGMMGARHMKRIDITRELLTAPVYPGDPEPRLEAMSQMCIRDRDYCVHPHLCYERGRKHFIPREMIDDDVGAPSSQEIIRSKYSILYLFLTYSDKFI